MTGFGASIQPSGTTFGNQPSGTTFGNQPSITTGFSAMKPTLGMISSIYMYMIDSDQSSDSNWCPLLKSASTDVIISNHGPI